MTTSLPHTHIRLRDLSELVAGIPYVIGFPPTDSLVLFTFRQCPDLALSTTIRVDLPKPEHVSLVATEVATAAARNEAVAAIAVVVGDSGAEHHQLVDMLRNELADQDIVLSHASWVPKVAHGEVWQCYDDPLCTEVVPDPQTSALAAASAVAGDTTYPNREAMAAQLAPDPEEVLACRQKLLDAYRKSPAPPYTEADLRADLELLGHVLDEARSSYGPPNLTDHQLVRLARAFSQIPVKDECLATVLSDEAEPAERLWTVLVRALPAPERAEPAFLLAISAYLRGAGVVAGLALRIVMEADPVHRMAVLLDYALRMGTHPDHLREMLMASIVKNNQQQADPSPTEDEDDPPWDTTAEQPSVPTTSERQPPDGSFPSSTEEPPAPDSPTPESEPPRIAPGPLSQEAATTLGIHTDVPVRRTTVMDALTAFLPPPVPTGRSGPG